MIYLNKEVQFVLMLLLSAVISYLIAGVNNAVIFSNLIYHKDIRELGSKNPGFTNFKRVFAGGISWLVLILDLLKVILPVAVFGIIFANMFDMRQFGAAYSGLFAMVGHAYPVWYKFKGGKSFIAGVATVWAVNWKVGLIALVIFMLILFTTHYMSVASICETLLYPVLLPFFSPESLWCEIFAILSAFLVVWRHKENITRLISKTEKKFYFKSHKSG